MKKLVIGAVLAILLLLIGIFALWYRGGNADDPAATNRTAAMSTSGALRRDALAGGEIPTWAVQRGADPRRIAGRVISAGGPIANATVRLGLELPGVLQPVAEVTTGPDGGFDFGARPAARFSVSAEATGFAPAAVTVELANPLAKPDQLVLQLGQCRSRLYGAIVDASGGPIAKARLRVAGLGGTDADATGQYSLCMQPRDANVRIEADGYASVEIPIHLFGDLRHDFELVPESALSGHVVDEATRPVAGARVVALPDPSERVHFVADSWTISDAEGRFRITNLAPARFRVFAYADGLASSSPKPAIASPGTAGKEIELVLARRARISGHVVMGDKPVAGARVRTDFQPSAGYSQADGSFVIDNVPLGPTHLFAPPFEVKAPRELKVDRARIDDLVVDVSPLGTIKGHVTRHGAPVANADVDCPPLAGQAMSDATGAFVLEGVRPGTCTLSGGQMIDALAFTSGKQVTIAAGETREVDLDLVSGGRARGVVVDEAGKPVRGVYVLLRLASPNDIGESMTDAKGEFECAAMIGGDYEVSVFASPAGGAPFAPASGDRFEPVHIKDGEDTATGIRLAIKYERLSIRGRVVDDTGAQVGDVHVEAFGRLGFTLPPSVRADGAGNFEIGNLTRGLYTLHAHAADSSEVEVTGIAAGATNVEIRLVRPGSIEGQLVGFTTPPVVNALTITQSLFLGNEAIVDGDHFTIPGLTPGTYRVEASSDSGADGQPVEVRSGQTAHVVLKSRGKGSLDGRVTEITTKAPIPGMSCIAALSVGGIEGGSDPAHAATTDAQGRFALDAPLGRVRVRCSPTPDSPLSNAGGDVEVAANATAHIELSAVRGVTPPGDIGFAITPITLPLTVRTIDPAGPAATSGLAVGDHIVAIDGAPVAGLLPFSAMMLCGNHRPGTTLVLTIERGGAMQAIKIPIVKLAAG